MALNMCLLIITLNVNGINAPNKNNRVAEYIREQGPCRWCLQETHLRSKDTHRLKEWKKIFHASEKVKKASVAALISDKTDFKTKVIVRDKEGHYIIIKGTIQQENLSLVNIYAPNIGAPKYVKQILMDKKKETDRNTAIVRDFNTPLTSKDRSWRH